MPLMKIRAQVVLFWKCSCGYTERYDGEPSKKCPKCRPKDEQLQVDTATGQSLGAGVRE